MEIEFLSCLELSHSNTKHTNLKFKLIGISMNQLNQLEQLYNSGSLFPKALRELLLLGGNTCYALNHLWYKTQQEIQSSAREWLIEYNNYHIFFCN